MPTMCAALPGFTTGTLLPFVKRARYDWNVVVTPEEWQQACRESANSAAGGKLYHALKW